MGRPEGQGQAGAGAAGPAQGARRLRQPAPGPGPPGAGGRITAQGRPAGGRRHPGHPGAHGWALLRRAQGAAPQGRARARRRHPRLRRLRGAARDRTGFPAGQGASQEGDVRRQGQRPRVFPAVAPGGHGGGSGQPRRRPRSHAGRHGRHAARPGPGLVRRARHREHVRGHPHRRGGRAGRVDGHAPLGVAGRRRARALRAHPRLGSGHRGEGDREPAGDHPLVGHDAAPLARAGIRGGCRGTGGRGSHHRGCAYGRPGGSSRPGPWPTRCCGDSS